MFRNEYDYRKRDFLRNTVSAFYGLTDEKPVEKYPLISSLITGMMVNIYYLMRLLWLIVFADTHSRIFQT